MAIDRCVDYIDSDALAKMIGHKHSRMMAILRNNIDSITEFGKIETVAKEYRGNKYTTCRLNMGQLLMLIVSTRVDGKTKAKVIKASTLLSILEAIENFDCDVPDRFVYAAADEHGRIKIGISADPVRRVNELNVGNADKLTLVFSKKATDPKYQSEALAHKKCEEYHVNGEWFSSEALTLIAGNEIGHG